MGTSVAVTVTWRRGNDVDGDEGGDGVLGFGFPVAEERSRKGLKQIGEYIKQIHSTLRQVGCLPTYHATVLPSPAHLNRI